MRERSLRASARTAAPLCSPRHRPDGRATPVRGNTRTRKRFFFTRPDVRAPNGHPALMHRRAPVPPSARHVVNSRSRCAASCGSRASSRSRSFSMWWRRPSPSRAAPGPFGCPPRPGRRPGSRGVRPRGRTLQPLRELRELRELTEADRHIRGTSPSRLSHRHPSRTYGTQTGISRSPPFTPLLARLPQGHSGLLGHTALSQAQLRLPLCVSRRTSSGWPPSAFS